MEDLDELESLAKYIKRLHYAVLDKLLPIILSTLKYFRLVSCSCWNKKCPAGVCSALLNM